VHARTAISSSHYIDSTLYPLITGSCPALLRALFDQLLHTGYLRGTGQEATAAQDLEFSKIGFSICVEQIPLKQRTSSEFQ
jgi:putative NADPH-quinone reductase